jgi:hypothetical protein
MFFGGSGNDVRVHRFVMTVSLPIREPMVVSRRPARNAFPRAIE